MGRRPKATHPYGLQMLGHYIITAVMDQLMTDYHINSTENTVSKTFIYLSLLIFVFILHPNLKFPSAGTNRIQTIV